MAPHWPESGRRQSTRRVDGVTLKGGGCGWEIPGGFVARYDEHARLWMVARVDGQPAFFGAWAQNDRGEFIERLDDWTYAGSLVKAVRMLRRLGYLAEVRA